MAKILEKDIQSAVLQYLKLCRYFVWKQSTVGIMKPNGSYIPSSMPGVADIIGVSPWGQFVAVEVKRPGGKASPYQLEFLKNVEAAGGLACIVYSVDDMKHEIKKWRDQQSPSGKDRDRMKRDLHTETTVQGRA